MKKILSVFLCAALCASFAGCKTQQQTAEIGEMNTDITFPIKDENIELKYWTPLNSKVTSFATSFSDILCYQRLEEYTGIKTKYIHPAMGQEQEQFNLMIASKELPDMVYYGWGGVPGGVDQYLEDGTIVDLTPYMETFAPNLNKILKENPQAAAEVETDSGKIYMFPFLKLDDSLKYYKGLLIRMDWLNKLGLSVPETPEEWYQVLKAFKTQDPNGNGLADEIPLVSKKMEALEPFINAFGVSSDFMVKDGKVVFGPAQPEYKEALAYVNRLFKEGLIDGDFYLTDDNAMDAKVISNVAGSMYGALTSHMSKYMSMISKDVPDISIGAAPSLKGADGKRYIFNKLLTRSSTGYGTAITRNNKYIAQTMKMLDYMYSEEGGMLFNFGVEGETYNLVNNEPVFSDKIMKNPEGIAVGDMLARYVISPTNGTFIQDPRYMSQMLVYEEQKSAPVIWSKEVVTDRILPSVTLTAEESVKYSALNSNIGTYKDEMTNKFMIGTESLDKFDEFLKTLEEMGLAEATAIQQAAYDRYLSRSSR